MLWSWITYPCGSSFPLHKPFSLVLALHLYMLPHPDALSAQSKLCHAFLKPSKVWEKLLCVPMGTTSTLWINQWTVGVICVLQLWNTLEAWLAWSSSLACLIIPFQDDLLGWCRDYIIDVTTWFHISGGIYHSYLVPSITWKCRKCMPCLPLSNIMLMSSKTNKIFTRVFLLSIYSIMSMDTRGILAPLFCNNFFVKIFIVKATRFKLITMSIFVNFCLPFYWSYATTLQHMPNLTSSCMHLLCTYLSSFEEGLPQWHDYGEHCWRTSIN